MLAEGVGERACIGEEGGDGSLSVALVMRQHIDTSNLCVALRLQPHANPLTLPRQYRHHAPSDDCWGKGCMRRGGLPARLDHEVGQY